MIRQLAYFTVGLILWLIGSVAAFADGSRVALVVGVGAYRHVPQLPNPPRDARAIAEALRRLGFEADLVVDPDRAALERAIRNLGARSRSADAALFFYAGHALEVAGRNVLIPVTAQIESAQDVPFETVDLDLLINQLAGARTTLIFLDACRDNPFLLRLGGDQRGFSPRGLAIPTTTATGTLVAFATAPGQTAADGAGSHSPFTAALLRYLETPGLELRQMLSRVRHDVRAATGNAQTPWESSALEGDFYFNPARAAAPPAPPPAAPAAAAAPAAQPPPRSGQPSVALAQPPIAPITPSAARPPDSALCDVPRQQGLAESGGLATMRLAGDGGACNVALYRDPVTKLPFAQMVVTTPPAHGTASVAGSVVSYRATAGYAGRDRFIVSTFPGGTVTVDVTVVTVQ